MNHKTNIIPTCNLIKKITVWDDANPRIVINLEDDSVLVYSKAEGFIRHVSSITPLYEYTVKHRDDEGVESEDVIHGTDDYHAKDEAQALWPEDEIISVTKGECIGTVS